jgi:hypothetical protein
MLTLIAALALTVFSAGSGGQDDYEEQWACAVSVDGPQGSSVIVSLQQTVGGTVLSRSFGWTPPVLDRFAPHEPRPDAPEITVFYDLTEHGEIGAVDMVLGSAASLGGPATTLAGATLSLDMDGRGPWTVAVPPEGPGPDYRLGDDVARYRSAFFDGVELQVLIERGGVITLSLLDADGFLAAQTRYDLANTGERAHLFVEAREAVMAMMRLPPDEAIAQHPETCVMATGTLSPGAQVAAS